MYKIGVIGDRDSICSFGAAGMETFSETDKKHAAKTLHHLAGNGYAVIFITEKLVSQLEKEIAVYNETPLPMIIPIPGMTGNTGIGMKNISDYVERSVGTDVFKDK